MSVDPQDRTLFQTGHGRVFLQEGGPSPLNEYQYQGCGRLQGLSQDMGAVTPIFCPDPGAADRFVIVDETQAEPGTVDSQLIGRMDRFNVTFDMAQRRCLVGIQARYGRCNQPDDWNNGWELIWLLERARFTDMSVPGALTALAPDDRGEIMVQNSISAQELVQVRPVGFSLEASAEVESEVIAVAVCDLESCGDCGDVSDGCQRLYAVTTFRPGSPPLVPELVYTEDGGETWLDEDIDTLGNDEAPNDLCCVGTDLVVVSEDAEALTWATRADPATWTLVADGFVPTFGPLGCWAASPQLLWIVGETGYIYRATDHRDSVAVVDAGVATAQDLNAVHGLGRTIAVAVGALAAVVVTRNGGKAWGAIVGPVAGNLFSVFVKSASEWWVGGDLGTLWYTIDGGDNWVQKGFPGDGAANTRIAKIDFATPSVGMMLVDDTTPGADSRVFRTLDGGYSWQELPDEWGVGPMTANNGLNDLAMCSPNKAIVGGDLDGTEGIVELVDG